jgi:hypothetical protein
MSTTTYNPLYQAPAEIPTLAEWRRASSNARFQFMDRRTSPEIRAIDQCVDAYSKLSLLPKTPTAQLWEAAVNLFEAIEVYKATPRGHKQSRLDAVELLKKQTQAVLTKLRWQKIREVAGNKPGMKPMVEHVWSEMHSPGHARVGHGDNSLDPNPWLEGKPGASEKYLFQYLRKVRAETPNPDNVLYIEDSKKWEYQIVFSETGLAYERPTEIGGQVLQFTKPITTRGFDNLATSPYAVDEDGVFYTETSNHSGGTLNHCSFLSGRPVMCAGNIGITNGIIGYIDNGSGHYRPTQQNLLKCLKALKEQVSPLYFDAIVVRNHASQDPLSAYLAGKYLTMKGRCLPIGYYPSAGPNTHYKTDLVEFNSSADLPDYMQKQDQARQRTALENKLKELLTRLENGRVNGRLTGKLTSDADRDIMKAIVSADFIPEAQKDGLKRYYENDQPMQQWLAHRSPTPTTNFQRPRAATR